MKKFKKFTYFMSLFVLTIVLCSCGSKDKPDSPKTSGSNQGGSTATNAEYKDTLTWGQGADVTSLDPHQGKETPAVEVSDQIFDTLTVIDAKTNEVKPQIAESWKEINEKQYQFKIRKGIKFHDGSDLTVEDVKFSLDRAIHSASVSYIVDFIDNVKILDQDTIEVNLKAPYAPILRNLSVPFAAIVPKKVVEKDEKAFINNPIGSGPYKFVEWKRGDSIKLEAFPDYFEGEAPTKNLMMKVIPEAAQRVIALQNNEIDIAYDIPTNYIQTVKDDPNLSLEETDPSSCCYISFNMNKKPFDDVRVRKAINMAINRKEIVETIMNGSGQAADSIIAPTVFGYYSPEPIEYNPEKAKELLKEAGVTNLKTSLWVNDNQQRIEVCQAIQAMLKEVNIDCAVEPMEFGSFIQRSSDGEHDMGYFAWITSTRDGDYTFYSLNHSTQTGAPGNRSFVKDPEVDELIMKGRTTTDEATRKEIYKQLQIKLRELDNNAPIIYTNISVGMNKKVEGFVLDPIGYHKLHQVKIAK